MQWCVVGDTFVTGCKPSEHIVFGPENFKGNPDVTDPRYSQVYSIICYAMFTKHILVHMYEQHTAQTCMFVLANAFVRKSCLF